MNISIVRRLMLFIALVHPHLEFKITAWSLCLATNKKRLESTVQRAIKVIPDLHGVSVTRTVRLARVEIPSMVYGTTSAHIDLQSQQYPSTAGQCSKHQKLLLKLKKQTMQFKSAPELFHT